MGSKSQRKGAAGERELAQILREYGYSCDRGGSLSFGEVADITGLPGIHIEVKRVEKLNVCEAMEQSIRDSERMDDGMPVLFHRRNRKPWLVTMRLEDWMRMYQKQKERLPENGSRPWLCRYIISRGWFCVKSLSLLPGGVPEQDRV